MSESEDRWSTLSLYLSLLHAIKGMESVPSSSLVVVVVLVVSLSAQRTISIPHSDLEGGDPVCVMDSPSTPVFEVSSGGFNPALGTSLDSCDRQCSLLGFPYVGVVEGSICFCSSTLQGLEPVGMVLCLEQCVGGEACGGEAEFLNVYLVKTVVKPNINLVFRDYEGVQVEVVESSEVYVNINSDMDYILDFGDGTGQFNKISGVSVEAIRYPLEGDYYITVTEPKTGVVVALQVTVYHPHLELKLSCPELVSTGEPFTCTFLEFYGYSPTLVVSSTETGEEQNYTIPGGIKAL
ncbi:hypothetical protein Pcinc_039491 [Petrolisthes cinctipes]|uniref:WSC domain-containing protein n=1 Tax=Petrolisthes cinctipes TaxID=88211 RepID=A0AAE1BP49_PETCI|nr:hypothetical protein Pcinc_039491 [Petrolisthes cinctipes]